MKSKKNKGFTLVELIITMALSAILLISIMAMTKPVNDLAKVATDYDTKRTVANEINDFVCKNIKYATCADVYIGYKDIPTATDKGIQKFMDNNGITDKDDVRIIAIINNFKIGVDEINHSVEQNINATIANDYGRIFKSSSIISNNKVEFYTAMGENYYGKQKYQFELTYETYGDTGNASDFNGVLNLKTITYDGVNESLKAKESSKFLNFNTSFRIFEGTSSFKNVYIIYSKK